MKNSAYWWLILISAVCIAFTLGFFIGRNANHTDIQISDVPIAPASPSASDATDGTGFVKVNINTADAAQLQTLPGIGQTLAQRIISYREANGPFTSLTDIANVPGIGLNTLENILDLITTGG